MIVKDYINLKTKYLTPDTPELCFNKEHFKNYTKKVTYKFNSKGYRDNEWPDDLTNIIWCVGDSFTVGVGQPFNETWPQLLEKASGYRCLNIGEDGCSNDSIALKTNKILSKHNPKKIIIMWSYFWRRRINGIDTHFQRTDTAKNDLNNFLKNFTTVNKNNTKILNYIIPSSFHENLMPVLKKFLPSYYKDIIEVNQIDYSRDFHHFDLKTSKNIIKNVLAKL